MIKTIGFALMFLATTTYAAPFIVADVAAGVTSCGVVLDAQSKIKITVVAAQCKFDVGNVTNGTHTVTMTAIIDDAAWGGQESAPSAPFTFAKPAAPSVPSNLRLTP